MAKKKTKTEEAKPDFEAIAKNLAEANAKTKNLLESKKFKSAIIGSILEGLAAAAGTYFEMEPTTILGLMTTILALFGVQIHAQGKVDKVTAEKK